MMIKFLRSFYPLLVLVAASAFFLYDILTDLAKGTDSSLHLLLESSIFAVTSLALLLEIRRVVGLRREIVSERGKVSRLSGELFRIMDNEFDKWRLTESEKEIAIFLIKGLSMTEIGRLRNVKEKTIRQQATQIYRKAGYSNRYELASCFIEDLMNTAPKKTF